jgi:SP family arabinose:H+ symporter-like MFS transporter
MLGIDKLGRRPLLLASSLGVAFALLMFAVEFKFHLFPNWLVLSVVLCSIVSYAIGIGPCSWLVISEIFPTKVRGRASAICTFTNWLTDYVILLVFPVLQEWSQVGTFVLFAGLTLTFMTVLLSLLPETKGKTLEEIEAVWRQDHSGKSSI